MSEPTPLPKVGDTAELRRTISEADVVLFAGVTGDTNPVHLDESYAKTTRFGGRIAHGMISAGLISAVMGTKLPGPGTIYLSQELKFRAPVRIGDTVAAKVEVLEVDASRRRVKLRTTCHNQQGELLVDGSAAVLVDT